MPQRKRYSGRKRYSSEDMNFHMPRVTKSLEFCAPLRKSGNVIFPSAGITATPVNTPTFSWEGMELNGNNSYVNYGDLTFLNAVSAFTIMFWMNQDVLNQTDYIFRKLVDASNFLRIDTSAGGYMTINLYESGAKYGRFDYSAVISANTWHHVSVVFDGSLSGNVNRLIIYVDGAPITLGFSGTIQATTVDMSGKDATVGYSGASFDGELKDFRIFSRALSAGEVIACMHPTT